MKAKEREREMEMERWERKRELCSAEISFPRPPLAGKSRLFVSLYFSEIFAGDRPSCSLFVGVRFSCFFQ